MKEATGEMNMTVITIIAVGAILAFFWFMWPTIQNKISDTWNDVSSAECIEYDGNGRCIQYGSN